MFFVKMYPLTKLDLIPNDLYITEIIKANCFASVLVNGTMVTSPYANLTRLPDKFSLEIICNNGLVDFCTEYQRDKVAIYYVDLVRFITSPAIALLVSAYRHQYLISYNQEDMTIKLYIYCLVMFLAGLHNEDTSAVEPLRKEASTLFKNNIAGHPTTIIDLSTLESTYPAIHGLLSYIDPELTFGEFTKYYTDRVGELTDLFYAINLAYGVHYSELNSTRIIHHGILATINHSSVQDLYTNLNKYVKRNLPWSKQ